MPFSRRTRLCWPKSAGIVVPTVALLTAAFALSCGDSSNTDSADGTSGSGGAAGTDGSPGTGGATGTGGGGMCPPTCFVNNLCVRMCGDTPQDFGCCSCPADMINARSCPSADSGASCGLVGTPCPGATDCGGGLSCLSGLCAPGQRCAPPPGGVGCGAGAECLTQTGTQNGICVTPEERACMCAAAASSFDCTT